MNTIEQIKAEIERRIKEDYNGPDKHDNEIAQGVCASIIAFLDTLLQEQPSSDLEVDLEKIIVQTYHDGSVADTSDMDHVDYENIARHFAEWQKEQMMKGAVDCQVVGKEKDLRLIDSTQRCLFAAKRGDWLKIIIVKEDTK